VLFFVNKKTLLELEDRISAPQRLWWVADLDFSLLALARPRDHSKTEERSVKPYQLSLISTNNKESMSMSKHQGLFLALGLAAVVGLSAPDVRAGNVTLTLTWSGGTTGPIDFTSPFAQLGSTADNLTIDTSVINAFLAGNGSDIMFSELGASGNNPGDSSGSLLRETGTAIMSGAGGDNSISIVASQDGFMSPSGVGTLTSTSTANFLGATTSTQTSFGALNGNVTANANFTVPGGFQSKSTGLTGISSGYTLSASTDITLGTWNGSPSDNSDQFTNNAIFVDAVPEPASITIMLTGMPLALVVLRLVRRRAVA
jgi:hypothetical protein